MHTCYLIITEEFPTNDVINEKIRPYNEDEFYARFEGEIHDDVKRPDFLWDYWVVGGRYGGLIKLKIDKDDEEYRWMFYEKEPRAGRLFRSAMCETLDKGKTGGLMFHLAEDEYRGYMGSDEGFIRVDGCKVKDVVDFEKTIIETGYGVIGKNGEVITREYWDGKHFSDNEKYEEQLREITKDVQDCYITVIDTHD